MNSPVLLINWFAQYSYEFYILHIATFSFIDEITKDQPFFQNLNVYNRYFYFLGLSFILCFSLSIVLSKATKSFLRQERKK
jgi:peptidoglycan/LPS O-acetylase OafA/YrhL